MFRPFPLAKKTGIAERVELDVSDAIPVLSRIVRYFFGGALIKVDENPCWQCGYWLFANEEGTPYCVWCGHSHRPPTRDYIPALYFACWTDEGSLIIV